ncbi:unnamed protein product, partial [Aureobasidium pullulans]
TIDLQNQDAPTTQDHHSTSFLPSDVGKHQAAEIRHVREERHSEEEHLQDAWSRAHQDIQVNELTDDQLQAHNHENGDSTDDSEIDDDMLDDRISSSPSIDDGAYPAALTNTWPHRSSSLTPPRQTLNCEAIDSPTRHPLCLLPYTCLYPPWSTRTRQLRLLHLRSRLLPSCFPQAPSLVSLPLFPDVIIILLDDFYHDDNTDGWHHLPSEPQVEYIAAPKALEGYNFSHGRSNEDLTAIPEEVDEDGLDMDDLSLPDMDVPDSKPASPSSWSTVSDASASSPSKDPDLQDNYNSDDDLDISLYSDDRFVDSGWGGECLRETEDIDFDFVYALHTFVATVEGQANAGKGDTMVLLDDSNSYWWLVRIVKDNSIGYLPAEHIETPTERLARLNKHRNVDVG